MIVNIEQHEAVHSWARDRVRPETVQELLTSIEFHEEHWRDVNGLDVEELHGVDGGDGEGGGLFVGVVQLVEMLTSRVSERRKVAMLVFSLPCKGRACGRPCGASR